MNNDIEKELKELQIQYDKVLKERNELKKENKLLKKDLEILEQLEILKKYYSPFKEFLEEMFEKGHNGDLKKIKEWLEDEN